MSPRPTSHSRPYPLLDFRLGLGSTGATPSAGRGGVLTVTTGGAATVRLTLRLIQATQQAQRQRAP
jgi:hypothetical protein